MKIRQTLCGLVAGLALLGSGCAPADNGKELGKEVVVPSECKMVYNFGYNPSSAKYFVACQKEDQEFSFYQRDGSKNDWSEIRFAANASGDKNSQTQEVVMPKECKKVYNLGYNYAASRYFVSCEQENKDLTFYTKRTNENDWKKTKFIANGKYLRGE